MKTICGALIFALLSGLLHAARPLPPLRPAAVSVDVRQENIDQTTTNWRTDWGSIGQDFNKRRVLLVTMRAVGEFDRNVAVEWYFVGKAKNGPGLGIYSSGASRYVIPPTNTRPLVIGSGDIPSYRDRYNALGFTVMGGAVPFGWVIIVWQNDRVLKTAASTYELGQDFEKRLEKLGPPTFGKKK